MRTLKAVAIAAFVLPPGVAGAQVSLGLGAGTGIGSRGGTSGGGHASASLELKLPVVPGIRGDLYYLATPERPGHISATVSAVLDAPVPVVTPYLIVGWGAYGIDASSSLSGWNAGVGARASLITGPALFVEIRRHQRIARDLLTIGLRF